MPIFIRVKRFHSVNQVSDRSWMKCWLRLFSKTWSVSWGQVVHLLSRTACVVRLLKRNIHGCRNLLPVSVRSQTVLLPRCPIEHNLSIIAFFSLPPHILFCLGAFFYCEVWPRLSRWGYGCASHCGHSWSPGAKERTYISLDCVSGRLLDKDHNMTLFLFCAGSVNRRKAPAAQHAPVQIIDHTSQTSLVC